MCQVYTTMLKQISLTRSIIQESDLTNDELADKINYALNDLEKEVIKIVRELT